MTAQCWVGSGYLPIFSEILFPMMVFSANHLPVAPATGCYGNINIVISVKVVC